MRERKKERTRATITRVALERFARDGFTATTLAAIAEAAEVSPRTVSTYFPTKEMIVFAEYETAIERLRRRLAERAPAESVFDAVGAWGRLEASQQDEVLSATVRTRAADGVDFARLRQRAIARDADLWALERRRAHPVAGLVSRALAVEFDRPPEFLPIRIAGEATAVALMEANARAAEGDASFAESLGTVLDFVRAGLAAQLK